MRYCTSQEAREKPHPKMNAGRNETSDTPATTTLLNGGRPTSGETPRNATPLAAREVGRGSPAGQPAPVEVEGDEMRFWGVLRDGVLVAPVAVARSRRGSVPRPVRRHPLISGCHISTGLVLAVLKCLHHQNGNIVNSSSQVLGMHLGFFVLSLGPIPRSHFPASGFPPSDVTLVLHLVLTTARNRMYLPIQAKSNPSPSHRSRFRAPRHNKSQIKEGIGPAMRRRSHSYRLGKRIAQPRRRPPDRRPDNRRGGIAGLAGDPWVLLASFLFPDL